MYVRSFSFNFILRKELPIVYDIYNLLEEMFGMAGEYESNETFHKSGILITADEKIQKFRIIVSDQQVEALRTKLMLKLKVDFNNYFIPIQNHFHPSCYIVEDRHEGTAYENKEGGWDVYYTEGTLYDLLDSEGCVGNSFCEKYFFSVTLEDICNSSKGIYDFMCSLFEQKVREFLGKN